MKYMKQYLITDPQYYHNFELTLKNALLEHKPEYACFRDKHSTNHDEKVRTFVDVGRKFSDTKLIVHSHLTLALKYKSDGLHVASSDFDTIKRAKENDLFVVASTHSIEEAKEAVKFGADALTFSPIFFTPKKSKPVGLEKLKEIIDIIGAPIFALGGIITDAQISALEKVEPYGFASIRYFLPKESS